MRQAFVLLVGALLLLTACQSRSSARQPELQAKATTGPSATIGDAVRELKAKADAGDMDYFQQHSEDATQALRAIRSIPATALVDGYSARLKEGTSTALLNYHDPAHVQISLVKAGGGWQFDEVYPCW